MIQLGMQHGNPLSLIVFCILSTYLYTNINNYSWKHFIFSMLLSIITYFAFHSRTTLILCLILTLGIPIVLKIKKLNKIVGYVLKLFPVIMIIAVILLSTVLYNTPLAQMLDTIITNRLTCANYYFYNFGVSLLPRYIPEYLVFDNMYAFMVVEYGIIFTIIYCVFYSKTIRKLLKNKRYIEVFLILLYALYAYCEKGLLKIFCNFPMLFIAYLFYDIFKENAKEEKNRKEDEQ